MQDREDEKREVVLSRAEEVQKAKDDAKASCDSDMQTTGYGDLLMQELKEQVEVPVLEEFKILVTELRERRQRNAELETQINNMLHIFVAVQEGFNCGRSQFSQRLVTLRL